MLARLFKLKIESWKLSSKSLFI